MLNFKNRQLLIATFKKTKPISLIKNLKFKVRATPEQRDHQNLMGSESLQGLLFHR
jgi:hypothetical protein